LSADVKRELEDKTAGASFGLSSVLSFLPIALIVIVVIVVIRALAARRKNRGVPVMPVGKIFMFIACMVGGGIVGCVIGSGVHRTPYYSLWFLGGAVGGLVIALLINMNLKMSNNQERQDVGDKTGNTKKCPFCANDIKKEAIVCQFCGRELPSLT
jgi:hypothetical protein